MNELEINLAQRTNTMRTYLTKRAKRRTQNKCNLKQCPTRRTTSKSICQEAGTVYNIHCEKCDQSYIGSTVRPLHQRINEHIRNKTSSVFNHNITCNGSLSTTIMEKIHQRLIYDF